MKNNLIIVLLFIIIVVWLAILSKFHKDNIGLWQMLSIDFLTVLFLFLTTKGKSFSCKYFVSILFLVNILLYINAPNFTAMSMSSGSYFILLLKPASDTIWAYTLYMIPIFIYGTFLYNLAVLSCKTISKKWWSGNNYNS
jgi:hypothetical protein